MHPRVELEKLMREFKPCSEHIDDDGELFGWRINEMFLMIRALAKCFDKLEEESCENKSS